jgi:hypothetical protein
MTTEAWTITPEYTVAGIGPYAITHPYAEGAIRAFVVISGVRTALTVADFTVTPVTSDTTGNLFLTPAAAATHAGRKLIIDRVTPDEQGWLGVQGEREKGLEAQLDQTVQGQQEIRQAVAGALRIRGDLAPFDWADGTVPLRDGPRVISGPTAADISDAQSQAEAAAASAAAAALSALTVADAEDILDAAVVATSALNAGLANINSRALRSANLSDLASPAVARGNLGLGPGAAGTVKMSNGTDYIDYSLTGMRRVEISTIDNPVGVSNVGFDFDWPAPPAGQPPYDITEIIGHFFGCGPTATARLVMQLKVDGVRVPQDYIGTGISTGMALPSLTGGLTGVGHATIYRMPARPLRWIHNSGGSATTALLDIGLPWVTAKTYAVGACVSQGGVIYRCVSAHTSGVFATDLAFPRWVVTSGQVTGIGIFQAATTFNGLGSLGVSFVG